MDNTEQLPTVLSFCTGYGGIELGLERAIGPLNVLAHVEVEAFAIANLVNKMETGRMVPAPVWSDLKTLRPEIFRGYVDILTGGYPCQPFSAAGKRLGSEDPRHLWPFIQEHIRIIQPTMVFLENVEGHLSKGVTEVLADLEEMAYRVECGVFSAAEVGAPHQRKRVFILAYRDSEGLSSTTCSWLKKLYSETEAFQGGKSGRISTTSWPARPGQEQYEWEEPKTVADTQLSRAPSNRSNVRMGWRKEQQIQGPRGTQIETKPQLGRTIDGNRDRVDRLRLCGNGVVPQTAEKAFRTLMNRILKRWGHAAKRT